MSVDATAIMIMKVTIPEGMVMEFNSWYDTVHIPELLRIPGIIGARRFESVEEPRVFLAIYEMEHSNVPETEAFRSWRAASVSTRQMMERFTSVERNIFRRIYPALSTE